MSAIPVVEDNTSNHTSANEESIGKRIDGTGEANGSLTPELVIALCGPIGSPLHEATDCVASTLADFNYTVEKIRLSNLIRINADAVGVPIDLSTKYKQVDSLIRAGDELRRRYGEDVLAKLAIAKIGADRTKKYGPIEDKANDASTPKQLKVRNQRICHVVDSIKNSAELDLLRLIYGDALFAIGVFSPLEIRRNNLERPGNLLKEDVDKLIDTDSGEEFSHGQSVRDTFPKCDFFLRIDHSIAGKSEHAAHGQLTEKLRRFFSLIFRTSVVTPSPEETAMYAAASAARNSACLSRQVGAAVTTKSGELLAVGWNDVPQKGGGLYGKPPLFLNDGQNAKSVHDLDERCFTQAGMKCYNDLEKKDIAAKIIESLVKEGLIQEKDKVGAVSTVISDTRVKDLIEFSRAVHAEMHAIFGASRVGGDRVLNGRLFVTTYPCHSCAKHIVASGISEVIYIEPYRKSLATRLHQDAITELMEGTENKVKVLQFDGIAPRRFIDLFEAGNRKRNGILQLSGKIEAIPSTRVSLRAIPRLEEVVVAEVQSNKLNLPELVNSEALNG